MILAGIYGMLFLQIFQVLPLFYREAGGLSEAGIGLVLAFNGLIVFGVEMPLVYYIENRFPLYKLIITGTALCGLSFLVLLMGGHTSVLYLGMFLLSISEILAMPFIVTRVVQRAGPEARGSYLGLYTMSCSLAFIISPFITTYLIEHIGFNALWLFDGVLALLTVIGFFMLEPRLSVKAATVKDPL